MKYIAKEPLSFEPGEKWQYSLCHDVLGAFVEVLSGEKFENYIKAHIFDPLGMENSDFLHPMEDWNGFARKFCYNSVTGEYEPRWKNAYRPGKEYASGGAGCVSTVEDYIKFLEALRVGDVILKKDGRLEFKTDNRQLFDFAVEELEPAGWSADVITYDLHADEVLMEGNVMTEYEEKFSSMGNPINKYIIYR